MSEGVIQSTKYLVIIVYLFIFIYLQNIVRGKKVRMARDQIELQNMCYFQALSTNEICTRTCFQKNIVIFSA